MAVVQSDGSLVATHRVSPRPSIARSAIELYTGRRQDYAELYRQQPNLRTVIRFLGRNIAQLGLKAYRRTGEASREELPPTHPLRRFLNNPTPALPIPLSRHQWIDAVVQDLALYDAVHVLKLRRDGPDAPLNGIRIPPPHVEVRGPWLWPERFLVKGNNGETEYAANEMIYIHGHDPAEPRTGIPPAESLRRILAEEQEAGVWREQYWRNSARRSGYIERPAEAPKWSDPARQRFTDDFRDAWTSDGPGAGGTPILEEGMKYVDAAFSPKDSEYLGARRLSREETAAAYFIPPVFVGILENANFSNVKEQHVSLYADTLGPWCDLLEESFELQLVPEFPDVEGVYLEFDIEAKLKARFEEAAAAMQTATGAPWLTRNEARATRNLPPVEGGDDLVVPLNVLVGGQASPTDSAPPPPGTAARGRKERNGEPENYLTGWQAKYREELSSFFLRQSAAVLPKVGAGAELEVAFDSERWNRELTTTLLAVSLAMTDDLGTDVAGRFGADFDLERTEAWLAENARIAAEGVNAATLEQIGAVWSGVPRRGAAGRKASIDDALDFLGIPLEDDDLDDPFEDSRLSLVRGIFDFAATVRIAQIATTRATQVGQWARSEGASQAGARTKTWIASGASNSRHAALDGETVPLGEPFSNGGQWPGDPSLGVDETAGCLCSLDFGTT